MDASGKHIDIEALLRFSLIILYGHTFATLSLQNGDDIKTVQGNLGHHTAAFTLDRYGHVTQAMQKASADRMDASIKSIKQG